MSKQPQQFVTSALFFVLVMGAIGVVCVVVAFRIIYSDRRPAVYFAVEKGNTNYISDYVSSGHSVNTPIVCYRFGHRMSTLLYIAVASSQVRMVDFLLDKGADPNQANDAGETPIYAAIVSGRYAANDKGRIRILNLLLRHGADPNWSRAGGYSPLLEASMLGQDEVLNLLLKAGADPGATNDSGLTALHLAATPKCVRILIGHGARGDARTVDGQTPAALAQKEGRFDVLNALTNVIGE